MEELVRTQARGIQEVLQNYFPVYTFGPVCGELEAFPIPY